MGKSEVLPIIILTFAFIKIFLLFLPQIYIKK